MRWIWAKLTTYWEWWYLLAYVGVLSLMVLPRLPWSYDLSVHSIPLMPSVRIWAGQVPFRDFYGWYGPLYHYLLALFVGPLGNNLYAIKFYLDFISPILCIIVLIISLRKFSLPVSRKIFVLITTPLLGLERIHHCGSLRPFVPVLVLALFSQAYQKGRRFNFFIFPIGFLIFLFSPEIGIYFSFSGLVFLILELLLSQSKAERGQILSWASAGLGVSLTLGIILYLHTQWLKNYLNFTSNMSMNMKWTVGLPFPDLKMLRKNPLDFYYYLPPLIYALGLGIGVALGRQGKMVLEKNPGWASLIIYGTFLWYTAFICADKLHLQFCFLPALIIASLGIPSHFKNFKLRSFIILFLLLIISGLGNRFFKPSWSPHQKFPESELFLGVRISSEEKQMWNLINAFYKSHPGEEIAFPLKSFHYLAIGKIPRIPFDAPGCLVYQGFEQDYVEKIKSLKAKYLIFNERDIFWSIIDQIWNALFDYIDQNYEPRYISRPLYIFEKREKPVLSAMEVSAVPGIFVLEPKNGFKLKIKAPAPPDLTYLEFKTQFIYRYNFQRRLSLPIAEWFFDGKKWKLVRPYSGAQRMSTMRGKQNYRLYLFYDFQELELQITFPGFLNFQPAQVIIDELRFYQKLNINTPRALPYSLEPEE